MLSVHEDADAAVETRILIWIIGWNKFRQLVPLLTNMDISLIMRGRLSGEVLSAGIVICLGRGADLHMVQCYSS